MVGSSLVIKYITKITPHTAWWKIVTKIHVKLSTIVEGWPTVRVRREPCTARGTKMLNQEVTNSQSMTE